MRILPLIIFSLFLVSCSSTKKEKEAVHEKVATSTINNSQSLSATIEEHIENSKTLSDAHKTELREVLKENKRLAEELMALSFQNRGVLIQELLTGKSTPQRVKLLEREIERIEKLRLKNTFDTVKRISKIVSGQPDIDQFAEEILRIDSRGTVKR